MKVPKYFQVKGAILELIAESGPGTPVSTERELAEQFSTSRTTVRQAIAELVVDGKLERTQGRGTFVARPKLLHLRQLTSFTQDMRAQGHNPENAILGVTREHASIDVGRNLQVPTDEMVHRVERLRSASGETIAHEIAYLKGPLPRLRAELEERGSLYQTLREAYSIRLSAVEDVVETAMADPFEASLLGVETGLPMLLVHRSAWDTSGRPVEWTRSVFRGDRFRFVARNQLESRHDG
jgi:GntR family transcriptional regulator